MLLTMLGLFTGFVVPVDGWSLSRARLQLPGQSTTMERVHPSTKFKLQAVDSPAEDGVSLAALVNVDEDGEYLRSLIVELLDNEWMPQSCHQNIGAEVKKIYVEARGRGVNDLNGILLEMGTGLSTFDMGDAFVGPW